MKFDDEICKGISCLECSFNKWEDGCLLAKRLDEIEITSEPCEDAVPSAQTDVPDTNVGDIISRRAAIDAIKEDKIDLTNPNVVAVFKATGDFEKVETQVMTCDRHIEMLKDLPSAQPMVLTCDGCRHVGTYDTDFPCSGCIRREKDYYEQE